MDQDFVLKLVVFVFSLFGSAWGMVRYLQARIDEVSNKQEKVLKEIRNDLVRNINTNRTLIDELEKELNYKVEFLKDRMSENSDTYYSAFVHQKFYMEDKKWIGQLFDNLKLHMDTTLSPINKAVDDIKQDIRSLQGTKKGE